MGEAADWAPAAAALAASYPGALRCVALHPPCHGGSGPVGAGPRPADLAAAAAAVAALARALASEGGGGSLQPVSLVGYSLGARLALGAAAGDPGCGGGGGVVCVSGGSPGLAPGRGGRPGRAARDASLAAALLRAGDCGAGAEGAGLGAWVRAWYGGPLWAPLRARLGAAGTAALAARRARALGADPAGPAHALAAWSPGRASHLPPPAIAALAARGGPTGPVLFITGGLDGRAAGAASAVGAAGDADVGVVTVPGVGHALLSEAPVAVVGALAAWVDARLQSERE